MTCRYPVKQMNEHFIKTNNSEISVLLIFLIKVTLEYQSQKKKCYLPHNFVMDFFLIITDCELLSVINMCWNKWTFLISMMFFSRTRPVINKTPSYINNKYLCFVCMYKAMLDENNCTKYHRQTLDNTCVIF